jgi:hypothetical protein
MPNVNKPFGLKPVEQLDGSPWNGKTRMYFIPQADTNAYAIGDPVTHRGTADARGVPAVNVVTPGSGILGVIVSCGGPRYGGMAADPQNLNTTVIPATKTRDYYVLVCDDPGVIYEVMEDYAGTALAAADVGLNANLKSGTNNGFISGWVVNNATEATTATLDVKLLGLSQKPGNEFGIGAVWRVMVNNHIFKPGSTGI